MKESKLFKAFGYLFESQQADEFLSLEKQKIVELLKSHGVILFRSPSASQQTFEGFTERLGQEFVKHGAAVRKSRSEDGRTQTVTKGSAAILLHTELHFSPFSPDAMWFYCQSPAQQGGQTTVASGVELFNKLSASTQKLFLTKKIKYKNIWEESSWRQYMPDFTKQQVIDYLESKNCRPHFDEDNCLVYEYITSATSKAPSGETVFGNSIAIHSQYLKDVKLFQETDQKVRHGIAMENGEEIPEAIFAEIIEASESITQEVDWRAGDIVMLNNRTVLHGRRAYPESGDREILVRMAMMPEISGSSEQ